MTRKQAREQAFFIIFEYSFSKEPIDQIIAKTAESRDIEMPEYATNLAAGIVDRLDELDAQIERNARGWKLERISRVSLAILRLAVYEMMFGEKIPMSVSINEAVNLCKTYAGEEDYAFVNGILGTIARERGGE